MEVTEITQRGYVLIFCLSIFFFNIAKIKQQTNQPTKHSPLPPKPNQTTYSKSMVLFYPKIL